MQLFGHPLKLVILDVDGVLLDLRAGFERHLEATVIQLYLPTQPIRDYLAAVRRGTPQFIQCFRTIERERPYPPVYRPRSYPAG